MSSTRITKSVYNLISGMGAQLLTIVMHFVCRTVFISTLGKSYLGISSLFSNILTMLSLAELGIGTAIIYYMYEPLAHHDQKRIVILMNFYRQAYRLIAAVIAGIGICLIPFLPLLINGYDQLEGLGLNAVVIFLLYLSQSVSTYLFFSHRSIIIKADQKEYILNIVSYVTIFGQNIAQILSLLLLKNFTVYVFLQVVFVILQNLINAVIAKRNYPYINSKPEGKIEKAEIVEIFKDCKAVFIYKLNRVVLKSTDNIVLSAILGLEAVALYSNYYIFYSTINSLYIKINTALIHSVGNLHTTKDVNREHLVFKALVMIMTILGGTVAVGIATVADEFISVWIGKEWVIPQPFSVLMGIELFLLCVQYFLSKYRNAIGLFQQVQFAPIFGSVINILLSVILVNYMGVSGVILGTIVAEASVFMVLDPVIIYKYGFHGNFSIRGFYFQLIKQVITIAATFVVARSICNHFIVNCGWISVAAHIVICGCLTPLVMLLVNIQNEETKYLLKIVKSKIPGKHRKK